jgi:MFS family permease
MVSEFGVFLAWVLAAGLLGLAISALFSGWLKLSRRVFLVPYVALSGAFLYVFARWSQVDLGTLFAPNWTWGLLAGAIVGAFLVRNVRSQPTSDRSTGAGLALDTL